MKRRQEPLSTSREAKRSGRWATGLSTLDGGPGIGFLLILVCVPLAVEAHLYIGDTFYFSQSPQSDKVVEGRPHTLHCNVSDTTNISFSWVKDGETVKRTHRRFMIGASLHMRRVSRLEDNGEYACIAHNMSSGFALTSLPAHLRVVWMGVGSRVVLAEPRSQSQLRKGSTVVLRCKVEASSDLDYDWFRNGDALQVGDRISTRSRRLTIVQIEARHNGMYSCRGRNQAGQTQLQNPFKLTLRGNNAPSIEVPPTIEVAREKDPAWIPCRYDSGTLIEWYHHDHGPLTNSSSYVVFPNGTLKVTSAGKETEGVYKCVGVHPSKAETQTYAGSLMLAYLDEVQEGDWFEPGPDVDDSHVVGDGGSMGVVCLPPRGFPVPEVNWTDPVGDPLPSSGRLRVEGTELIVEEAREDDGGVYTCTAVNIAATARAELNLYITRRPRLLSGPSPRTIEEGESTQMQCAHVATQHPYTNVSWLHDGKQLPQHGQRLSMLNNGNLQIRNSSVTDAGDYSCVVRTVGFPAITSPPALLVVREQLKFDASLKDEMLELNSTARVPCVAKGHVPPTVRWKKLGARDGSRLPSHLEDDNGTLVFGSVTRDDEGQYLCEATSSQGTINTTINITVVEPPVLIKTSAGTVEAELGEGVWLHCLAKGHPPPTVRWDYNKAPGTLHSDRVQVFDNGTLHITKTLVYDEGVYGCMVGNAGGLKRVEILLIVKAGGEVVPRTVAVTLGAAGAYLLLVASLLIYCRHRRRRLKSSASPQFRGACEHMATLLGQGGTAAEGNTEGGGGRRRREGNGNERQDSNPGEGPSDPNKKSKTRAAEGEGEEIDNSTPNHTSWKKNSDTKNKTGAKGGGGGHLGGSLASTSYTLESSSQSNQHLAHVQIEKPPLCRDNLQVLLTLGRGEFGDVQLARMKGQQQQQQQQQQKKQAPQSEDEEEANTNQDSLVMIKVISTRDEHLLAEVCREVEMYNGPGHANIVSLVGVIADSQPNVVVLHYTDWGDLKQFLLATRKDSARPTGLRPPPLNVPHAMQLMLQVARGLEYLSGRRQTHRDVAARNCLITSTLQVKLASPALSRDAYAREYFTYRNQVLPVRWLAPEALLEDDHSMKSDVFSWAWLAWEILTQALMPHAALSDTQVVDSVKQRDLKFSTPSNIPESLGTLIHSCWNCSPRNRPAISNVVSTLHSTLTATPS